MMGRFLKLQNSVIEKAVAYHFQMRALTSSQL